MIGIQEILLVASVIVSIASACGVVWKLMLPHIKKAISEELGDASERIRKIEELLERDYKNIEVIKRRQVIIQQGLVALMKSVEDSDVMNNKEAIAAAKENLYKELLEIGV